MSVSKLRHDTDVTVYKYVPFTKILLCKQQSNAVFDRPLPSCPLLSIASTRRRHLGHGDQFFLVKALVIDIDVLLTSFQFIWSPYDFTQYFCMYINCELNFFFSQSKEHLKNYSNVRAFHKSCNKCRIHALWAFHCGTRHRYRRHIVCPYCVKGDALNLTF